MIVYTVLQKTVYTIHLLYLHICSSSLNGVYHADGFSVTDYFETASFARLVIDWHTRMRYNLFGNAQTLMHPQNLSRDQGKRSKYP